MRTHGFNPSEEDLRDMIRNVDKNANGAIDFNEFIEMMLKQGGRGSTSEIRLVETLIRAGKQKFLIHPLIEIFLKEKWGIIGKIYLVAGKVVHREILNVNEVVLGLPSMRKAKKRLYKLQYFSSILLGILRFPQWFRFHQLWPILVR